MQRRLLIKGGRVITSADSASCPAVNDVLVVGKHISQIAPRIAVAADEVIDATGRVVMPGLIDSHRHAWHSALGSGFPTDGLKPYLDQAAGHGRQFSPEDVYVSNLLSAVEAIDAGVTTMLDWSDVSRTPEHSDAAIAALSMSGIRAVHAVDMGRASFESDLRAQNLRRLIEQHGTREDSLLTVAMGIAGPEFGDYTTTWRDLRTARDLGVRISMHVGCSNLGARDAVERIDKEGLLGPDITYVHANFCSDRALDLIRQSGGSIVSSPAVESMGRCAPPYLRFEAFGLTPSLGVDFGVGVAGNLFTVMRSALAQSSMASRQLRLKDVKAVFHAPYDVLGWGTIEGARTLGLDEHVGTLEVGKQADLIVLELKGTQRASFAETASAVVNGGSPASVTDVVIAGRVAKRGGHVVGIDVESLRIQAAGIRERVISGAHALR